jgi:hypothetical protein
MGSFNILILTEDKYGVDFFKKLVQRFKKMNIMDKSWHIYVEWMHGKCNPKIERIINAKRRVRLGKIVVIADAEGDDKKEVIRFLSRHIPEDLKDLTKYVIFNDCIEEWICEGLGIERKGIHPIDCLSRWVGEGRKRDYEKYMLPDFADRIDIPTLRENNTEFSIFISEISRKD